MSVIGPNLASGCIYPSFIMLGLNMKQRFKLKHTYVICHNRSYSNIIDAKFISAEIQQSGRNKEKCSNYTIQYGYRCKVCTAGYLSSGR
jgi:hypothetical protein